MLLLLQQSLDYIRSPSRADHDSLEWMLNLSDASGSLARWHLRIYEVDFDVAHRASVELYAAGDLSKQSADG